jgi:hypothetical protein
MKTKRKLRQEAIERLREDNYPGYYRALINDIVGDDFDELTGRECVGRIIDLLTDDDDTDDYIRLPVDANGEVIHIGDEMVVGDYRYIVDGVGLADRTDVFFVTDGDKINGFPAKVCRHYRKPTMKDVLWDFLHAADDAMRRGYEEPPSEVFDEFIAKLKEVMAECE